MNTLETARSILDELGATYRRETGPIDHLRSWTACEVETGSGNTIRIYSEGPDAPLVLAERNRHGVLTGESITLASTDKRLTELTIKMLLELHA